VEAQDTESTQSSPDTKPRIADSGAEQLPHLKVLESVTTRDVTPEDLAKPQVMQYVTAVIMAPLTDDLQIPDLARKVVDSLNNGFFKARWIISSDGRRAGVIVFIVQDKVLHVVGIAFPPDAPASGWDSLVAHGKDEARLLGCTGIHFDVYGTTSVQNGIVAAAMRAGARGRFDIGV
jgi:hypothetical protein